MYRSSVNRGSSSRSFKNRHSRTAALNLMNPRRGGYRL